MNHLAEAKHAVGLIEGSMQPYTDEYRNQAIAHALIAIAEQLEKMYDAEHMTDREFTIKYMIEDI